MNMEQTFKLTKSEDGIALLTIDLVAEKVNTLKAEFIPQVNSVLEQVRADGSIKGLVIISGKTDSFIAGADITMLDTCSSFEEAKQLSLAGQQLFNQIEQLSIPVVAAINGSCLGGGLELALACHYRVCSLHPKTMLGLPEVQLGLLPGSGGTQRLPRLVGVTTALDMMLTGKQLRPKQAIKVGLVDDIVPEEILLQTAIEFANRRSVPKVSAISGKVGGAFINRVLEASSFGRNIIFKQAAKQVYSKTQGNYPAPDKIINCVRQGIDRGFTQGLEIEATHFAELVMTKESKALRSLFFATTEMKKESGARETAAKTVSIKPIKSVMVLGGGLMGGGIAAVTATKAKLPVRVKDISEQGVSNALSYAYKLLQKGVKRRYMTSVQCDKLMSLMTTTTEYRGVKKVDIVIEAVFEDLNLKHQMVKEVEQECNEETIFATNTSSLPISQIAKVAQRPENVIGLHYFSPVDKMPLVEVIAHDKTSAETIAATVAFARKQGKTPIVVRDGAGFYVNRILALYMNEAAELLLEGHSIEQLDGALVKFGFPVGPMTLLDEVGIDVGAKISPILESELGERFKAPAAFSKLIKDDRKGRKNSRGFYRYDEHLNGLSRVKAKVKANINRLVGKQSSKVVDDTVYSVLGLTQPSMNKKGSQELAQRCVVQMLNEAVRCLEEEIISSARDGDIGAIFGIGFPPFLGGPFRYIDSLGCQQLVAILEGYQQQFGIRFKPCQLLKDMADNQQQFYQ